MIFDFSLFPLFFSVLVLTLLVLAIGIHFAKNVYVMMLVIPVSLICVFSTYKTVTNVLGYPVSQVIPDKSFYLAHTQDPNKDWIFVWIIEPDKQLPKNVKIPNTEKNQNQLQTASERSQAGIPQQLKGEQTADGNNGPFNAGNYEAYDFILDDSRLKQYNSN